MVFGTRPEAIKLPPVIRELRRHPDRVVCKVCVTAQHRQMLDQVLRLFGVVCRTTLRQAQGRPFGKLRTGDLNVMVDNQTPTQVASAVLARLERIKQAEEDRVGWKK